MGLRHITGLYALRRLTASHTAGTLGDMPAKLSGKFNRLAGRLLWRRQEKTHSMKFMLN